jgi:hypothetical protein
LQWSNTVGEHRLMRTAEFPAADCLRQTRD